MKTPQDSDLASVGHRICQRTLKKLLIADSRGECRIAKVVKKGCESFVKAMHFLAEAAQSFGRELSSMKHCTRVSHQSCHVPDQLMRRAHFTARVVIREIVRCAAQRFLRSICECGEKMLKKSSRFVHWCGFAAHAPSIARSCSVIPVLLPGGIVAVM